MRVLFCANLTVTRAVPESVSSSMDNDSGQEDFVAHMISAFNQPRNGGNDLLQAQDLEELMIMEAIRRSLTDVKRKFSLITSRARAFIDSSCSHRA
jgi:hypothetical protein